MYEKFRDKLVAIQFRGLVQLFVPGLKEAIEPLLGDGSPIASATVSPVLLKATSDKSITFLFVSPDRSSTLCELPLDMVAAMWTVETPCPGSSILVPGN